MRRLLTVALFMVFFGCLGPSQAAGGINQEWSCENGKVTLTLSIDSGRFVSDPRVLLFTISGAGTSRVHADTLNMSHEPAVVDAQTLKITYKQSCNDPQNPPFPPIKDSSYFLELDRSAIDPPLDKTYDSELKFDSGQILSASSVYHLNDIVRVKSSDGNADLGPSDSTVTFSRSRLAISKDHPDVEKTTTSIPATPCTSDGKPLPPGNSGPEQQFCLGESLRAGEEYQLKVANGLRTIWGEPVQAKGTLKPAAAPKPDDAKITGSLNMTAAVHKAAVFNLTGKYSPLYKFNVFSESLPGYWDPSLSVDVGLRSTDSKNAITASALYRLYPTLAAPGPGAIGSHFDCSKASAENYCRWRETPWNRLSALPWAMGPRLELDRDFHRVNLLAVGHLDLQFYRWMGAISDQQSRIKSRLKPADDLAPLVSSFDGPHFGFNMVPYVELNAGGHVNDETLTNKGQSVDVPQHAIFRVYAGLNPTFEVYRWALSIDGSLVELAHQEQIGVTTATGVQLFKISGIHPHSLASIKYFLDPDRRYCFSVSYENGRAAPNFNYLSKFSAGLNFVY